MGEKKLKGVYVCSVCVCVCVCVFVYLMKAGTVVLYVKGRYTNTSKKLFSYKIVGVLVS